MNDKLSLHVRLDALDRLSKPLRGAGKESAALNAQLRLSRDRVKALEASQRDIAAFRGHEEQIVATRMKLEQQRKTVAELGAAYRAADSPTKTLTRNFTNAREALARLEREEEQHRSGLRETEARLKATGVATADLARHEQRLAAEIAETNVQIRMQKDQLGDLAGQQKRMDAARARYGQTTAFTASAAGSGAGAIGAGMAVAAPLVIASREAMKFEDAMADVRKVVDFPTPASFKAFSTTLLDLSTRIPVSADGLAQIAALGARAGVPLKDLAAFTETAAKMGVAFDLTAQEAGAMMATWRTAFGMGQKEVVALADQVNALTNSYGGNAARVSDMITRIGPLGEVAGVGASSLGALAQVMDSVGVQSEVGATGLKNMMLALTKGEAATKAQKEAFTALGLDASKVAKQMQTDSEGAISGVLAAIAKLPEAEQLGIMGQLFGTESVAAISPLLTRLDEVGRNFRAVGDAQFYAGSMDKEYAARAATTSNALALAGNNAKALGVEIGSGLLPIIKDVSQRLGGAAQMVRDFTEKHPVATKVVGGLVAILAGLLLAFGGIALVIAAVLAPFALLQLSLALSGPLFAVASAGLISMATGAWAAAAGFIAATWPILATIAAIALVGLAINHVWRNWSTIGPMLARVWQRICDSAVTAISFLIDGFLRFHPLGLLTSAFVAVWPYLAGLGTRFSQLGRDMIAGLIDGVLGMLSKLKSTVTDVASKAAGWFKDVLGIRSPSRVFMAFGGHTMGGLALGIEQARNRPIEALGKVGAAMTGALSIGAGSPAMAGNGPGPGSVPIGGDTFNITVNAATGMDAKAIVDQVMREIQQAQANRRRASFRDEEE